MACGPNLLEEIIRLTRHLWDTPPDKWESILHEAQGFKIFKKGDKSDLSNYRFLWLIQVVSRLIAKIMASRLAQHAEEHDIFGNTQ